MSIKLVDCARTSYTNTSINIEIYELFRIYQILKICDILKVGYTLTFYSSLSHFPLY